MFSQAHEVPVGIGFRDLAAKDITIKFANAFSILVRNENRRMVAKDYLSQSLLLSRVGALNRIGVVQNGRAGLQQGLQVGDDLRPAPGHRFDEFRGFALDGVADGKLDRRSAGLQFHRAERLAFGLELGLVLVLPADHESPGRLGPRRSRRRRRFGRRGAPPSRKNRMSTGFRSERRTSTAS